MSQLEVAMAPQAVESSLSAVAMYQLAQVALFRSQLGHLQAVRAAMCTSVLDLGHLVLVAAQRCLLAIWWVRVRLEEMLKSSEVTELTAVVQWPCAVALACPDRVGTSNCKRVGALKDMRQA
jgi:hypothetical protein